MSLLAAIDQAMFRYGGYPYMRLTRDDSSFDRVLYLAAFLRQQNRSVRLLDAGCGGAISFYVLEREVPGLLTGFTGLDLHASRLNKRYAHFTTPHEFHDVSLEKPWDFGHFDVAWCSECLEHIMEDRRAFQNICRAVGPGGHVLVSMPSEAHHRYFSGALPALVKVSPVQDGGHVRIGYTPESLIELARGTRASLVRVDAITRTDVTYLQRRFRWNDAMQPVRNAFYTLTRRKEDLFTVSANAADLKKFQSIAAVYQIV